MKLCVRFVVFGFLLACGSAALGQTSSSPGVSAVQVPRIINFSGIAKDESGQPMTGSFAITFALYQAQQGGSPLWVETQNVQADSNGNYTAPLGSATPGGLPLALFSSTEAHWISTQISGQPESARVLLLSVPYALKASDAETLGGLPAAAFLQVNPAANAGTGTARSPGASPSLTNAGISFVTGLGAANFLPLWSGPSTITNSGVYQAGGNLGIGTTTPGAKLDVRGPATGVAGISSGATAVGVFGQATNATGSNAGVEGVTTSTGTGATGVYGVASAKTGQVFGVGGLSNSSTTYSAAVSGYESAATGQVSGVAGTAVSTTTYAAGVSGYESALSGVVFGSSGYTASTTSGAAGVDGYEAATSGVVYGVTGGTSSATTYAAGVNGFETALTGTVYGVNGSSSSSGTNAAGVNGFEGALTGQVSGVSGSTNSSTDFSAGMNGYEGAASGLVYGVSGGTASSSSNAAGVDGHADAPTGAVFGVNGNTNSTGPFAAAVNGFEGATTGVVWGVNGSTNSTTQGAAGVNGFEGAATGLVFGVIGSINTTASGAAGVAGTANATTGVVTGVSGITNSSTAGANGVFGGANAATGTAFGVQGYSNSAQGIGVQGSSPNVGVVGANQVCGSSACNPVAGIAGEFVTASGGTVLSGINSSTSAQVFRVDSSGNGLFTGNLNVSGTLTKGGGSFKIDDPLDPANKYLSHSFVESPDMMNVYNGNVMTDRHGLATVVLPQYFQALNRDFRYQLTVIGQFAQAIVAREVRNNRFIIKTSKPMIKVSWQVTGIRQDAYANAHRIPVEEQKPVQERGHYLHPELFGAENDAIGALSAPPATQPPTLEETNGNRR